MSRRRRNFLVAGGVLALLAALAALRYYYAQTTWVASAPYERTASEPARTLVVVYSRTGNTLGAAKEVARYFGADMVTIDAPQYGPTMEGQLLAAEHALEEVVDAPIDHPPVELSRYDLIVLCSPTWWYRPAVPMWSFVTSHDFAGKPVFLLMTGNSRLTEEKTGAFEALVREKHGTYLGRLFVRRGRIVWQKAPDEVHQEVREALEARREQWPAEAFAR